MFQLRKKAPWPRDSSNGSPERKTGGDLTSRTHTKKAMEIPWAWCKKNQHRCSCEVSTGHVEKIKITQVLQISIIIHDHPWSINLLQRSCKLLRLPVAPWTIPLGTCPRRESQSGSLDNFLKFTKNSLVNTLYKRYVIQNRAASTSTCDLPRFTKSVSSGILLILPILY